MRPLRAARRRLASPGHGTPGPCRLRLADPRAVVRDGRRRRRPRAALRGPRRSARRAAHAATGSSPRPRAIGTGIWTMHFVAMLGFGVTGTEIRYDVPLTILSLLVAMAFVGAGLFAVGYGRDRTRAFAVGGLTTGLGVAGMHYLGMAALRLHGRVDYDATLVVLSVAARRAGRDRRPVGRAHHQVARGGHRRLPRHGRGGEQHALHRNDGGERARHPFGAPSCPGPRRCSSSSRSPWGSGPTSS